MPRRQLSMQAAGAQLQTPGYEHSPDGCATSTLLRLPAELQKIVVEYVGLNFVTIMIPG